MFISPAVSVLAYPICSSAQDRFLKGDNRFRSTQGILPQLAKTGSHPGKTGSDLNRRRRGMSFFSSLLALRACSRNKKSVEGICHTYGNTGCRIPIMTGALKKIAFVYIIIKQAEQVIAMNGKDQILVRLVDKSGVEIS